MRGRARGGRLESGDNKEGKVPSLVDGVDSGAGSCGVGCADDVLIEVCTPIPGLPGFDISAEGFVGLQLPALSPL